MLISSAARSQLRGEKQKHNYTCKEEETGLGGGVASVYGCVCYIGVCLPVHVSCACVHTSICEQLLWHFDVCCVQTTYCEL